MNHDENDPYLKAVLKTSFEFFMTGVGALSAVLLFIVALKLLLEK